MPGEIFLQQLDELFEPVDPAIWFGPIPTIWPVEWIGYVCNEAQPPYVPELENPDFARLRRVGRLCVGIRPPRSAPRGFRFFLPRDINSGGTVPPGLFELPFEATDPNSIESDLSSAIYSGPNGDAATVSWQLQSSVTHHATATDPLAYVTDDFTLNSSVVFVDSSGDSWRLYSASKGWQGAPVLTNSEIPSLMIARQHLGKPANKERAVVFEPLPFETICGDDWDVFPFDVNIFNQPSYRQNYSTPGGQSPNLATVRVGAQLGGPEANGGESLITLSEEAAEPFPRVEINRDVSTGDWEYRYESELIASAPLGDGFDIVEVVIEPSFGGFVRCLHNGINVGQIQIDRFWDDCTLDLLVQQVGLPYGWQRTFGSQGPM